MSRPLRLIAVAILAFGAPGLVRAQSVAERVSDLRLETAVRLALVADADTRPLDVDVEARAGRVALSGEIPYASRSRVVSVARSTRGVFAVEGLGADASDINSGRPVRIESRPTPRPETAPASEAAYHTVASGDTLFGLARRYNTTVDVILRLNNMASTQINLGQRLRVR